MGQTRFDFQTVCAINKQSTKGNIYDTNFLLNLFYVVETYCGVFIRRFEETQTKRKETTKEQGKIDIHNPFAVSFFFQSKWPYVSFFRSSPKNICLKENRDLRIKQTKAEKVPKKVDVNHRPHQSYPGRRKV